MKKELINLSYDLDRWAMPKKLPKYLIWLVVFIYPATWAIIVYRIGRIINLIPIRIIRLLFKIPYFIIKRLLCESFLSIDISEGADIGPGFHIAHSGAIVIGKGVKAGVNFSIRQGVTCGGTRKKGLNHPEFGNNVVVAAGAVIAGNIIIGNNVMIGANSVVTKSFKDNTTVAGVPAKSIDNIGSLEYGIKNLRKLFND